MSDRGHRSGKELSRREVMKRSLQAGAYAAPVILSAGIPAAVAAATPLAPLPLTTFGQDSALSGAGAGATFDVYYTLSSQPAGTLTLLGTITMDRFGFGGGVFPLTVDPNTVSSVKLTYILHGNPSTSPPAATFTSTLVSLIATRQASFLGLVVQEPTVTGCQTGPLNQYNEYIDVAIMNGPANTSYDFYVQPNTVSSPVKVTTASTNAQGNVTVFAPGLVTLPAPFTTPSSVTVLAVPAGGSPSSPAFTLTATTAGGNLTTISCTSLQSSGTPHAIGISGH